MTLMMMFHAALAITGLVLGAMLLLRLKGTITHRFVGWIYAATMIGVAMTGVLITVELGRWSLFLIFSALILINVPSGLIAVWKVARIRDRSHLEGHYYFMSWSYAGLVLALIAQSFLTAFKLGFIAETVAAWSLPITVVAGTALCTIMIERAKARTLARYGVAVGKRAVKPA